MKMIVESTGDFMLMDVITGAVVEPDRPAVVPEGAFVANQVAIGQLRILHTGLSDDATDAEFAGWLAAAEDRDLAIASFASKFEPKQSEAEPVSAPEKPKRSRG